jgi:hypothetical protein
LGIRLRKTGNEVMDWNLNILASATMSGIAATKALIKKNKLQDITLAEIKAYPFKVMFE